MFLLFISVSNLLWKLFLASVEVLTEQKTFNDLLVIVHMNVVPRSTMNTNGGTEN